MNKIFSIFNLSFCLSFSGLVHGQVEEVAKEKSYSEKIKEAYEKGVKGAKEKYAETLGDGAIADKISNFRVFVVVKRD